MTEEAKAEMRNIMNQLYNYIRPNGEALKDVSDFPSEAVMKTMTT